MYKLLILIMLSVEIAAIKFVWESYGIVYALLAGGFLFGIFSSLARFIFVILASIFEYDEGNVPFVANSWGRLWRAAFQFVKSSIFVNLNCMIVNIMFLIFTLKLNPDSRTFAVIREGEFIFAIYYAFFRSLNLFKKMSIPPQRLQPEAKQAA